MNAQEPFNRFDGEAAGHPEASGQARKLSQHAFDLLGVGTLHDEQLLEQEEHGVGSILDRLESVCISKTIATSHRSAARDNGNTPNVVEMANEGRDMFDAYDGFLSKLEGLADRLSGILPWYGDGGLKELASDNSGDTDAHTEDWRSQQWSTKTEKSGDERSRFAKRTKDI